MSNKRLSVSFSVILASYFLQIWLEDLKHPLLTESEDHGLVRILRTQKIKHYLNKIKAKDKKTDNNTDVETEVKLMTGAETSATDSDSDMMESESDTEIATITNRQKAVSEFDYLGLKDKDD